jgi:hypothetical protein
MVHTPASLFVAPGLRILQRFAAICRGHLLICFVFNRGFRFPKTEGRVFDSRRGHHLASKSAVHNLSVHHRREALRYRYTIPLGTFFPRRRNHDVAHDQFFFPLQPFLGVTQSQTSPRSSQTTKSRNLLLVVNQGDQSMSLVDPEAGVQIAK